MSKKEVNKIIAGLTDSKWCYQCDSIMDKIKGVNVYTCPECNIRLSCNHNIWWVPHPKFNDNHYEEEKGA